MKSKPNTTMLMFSVLLLVVGIVIGIFASKYLQVFNPPATTGTLIATIIRSPTCPGAQKLGEVCEAPVANETFKIIGPIGPTDDEIIQTVTTDRDGEFTMTLEAGSYQIRNTLTGIGNNINNRDFTIVAGKTTTQQFDIDTGIR